MNEKKYLVLTDNNITLSEAYLIYMNAGYAVLRLKSERILKEISGMKFIRFHKLESYAEMFEGEVCQVKEDRLYVDGVVNISACMRSDLKVKVKSSSTITIADKDKKDGDGEERYLVSFLDISCGGLCIQSSADLDTDRVYEIIIPITVEPIMLNFEIKRKNFDEERKVYIYGGRFKNLNHNEERLLREAIFRLQMRENRKLLGNGEI